MRRRITYTIFIILGVLMVGAVVYVAVFNWDSVLRMFGLDESEPLPYEEVNNEPVDNNNVVNNIPVNNNNDGPRRIVADPVEIQPQPDRNDNNFDKDDLTRMAESFAERFGSFSNQSNFANILDLKLFMSDKMKRWADNYIREHRGGTETEIYYGITTRAIGHMIVDWNDDAGTGQVVVHTRRRESTSTTLNATNSFSQDIAINFVKEKGAWKVDAAFWQD